MKNKSILIITDKYFPKSYANAVCGQNIADVFTRNGYSVHFICFKDSGIETPTLYKNCHIHSVVPDLRLRLYYYSDNYRNKRLGKIAGYFASFLSKTRQIFTYLVKPFYSISFPKRIERKIEKLDKEYCFESIITLYIPFDGCLAMYNYKKRNIKKKWIIYCIDTISESKYDKFIDKYLGIKVNRYFWVDKFINLCDLYIYMESRKKEYIKYGKIDRLKEANLPNIVPKKYTNIKNNDKEWFYLGSIGGVHYKYEKMIDFCDELINKIDIRLNLYCRGNDVEKLKQYVSKKKNIYVNDYVSHEEYERIIEKSLVLVSVKSSNQISAKIFDYISANKIIIHFSCQKDDPDVYYLEKYKNAIIVKLYEDNSLEDKIDDFIKNYNNIINNFEDNNSIEEFEKCTPEYSFNLMSEVIK